MVASIPLPCTARSRPASARKDPGEATEGSAAVVSSSDRLLLEPSSLRTAALCTGAGSLPLDTGIGTHDHLGAALATSQIAPRGRSLIGLLQRSILTESIALRQKSISSGRKAGLASPGNPLDGHTERVEDAASPSWSNRAPRHVSCSLRSTVWWPWLLLPPSHCGSIHPRGALPPHACGSAPTPSARLRSRNETRNERDPLSLSNSLAAPCPRGTHVELHVSRSF